jgi:hypothetical protein
VSDPVSYTAVLAVKEHTVLFVSGLLAAKAAGHPHITVDGTLIVTDRCRALGPTAGVDLPWPGEHAAHGGTIQVVAAPDGWPMWTSGVRPAREHATALRAHAQVLPLLGAWTDLRACRAG